MLSVGDKIIKYFDKRFSLLEILEVWDYRQSSQEKMVKTPAML